MAESDDTTADGSVRQAKLTVHWPTGPVLACLEHGQQLKALGANMGAHIHTEPYAGPEPCPNCANQARKPDAND